MAAIAIEGLRKTYPGSQTGAAVDGIDLSIADGEVVALLGPSGCGKTTMLQLLAGFLAPDEGEIRVGGRVVSSAGNVVPPERRRMSLVFQSYAIWPHKTVAANVAYGLHLLKLNRAEIESRTRRMLDVVRLGVFADQYPSELSGGQQQRVALARALVVEPEILLLDEPLSNLDANLREEMRFEIRRLHDELGTTTIYVTHDQEEAMVTADRIAVLNRGRVEQVGPPGEVFEKPDSAFVATFIGRTNTLEATHLGGGVAQIGNTKIVGIEGGDVGGDTKVYLCVRPHDARIFPGSSSGNDRLSGKITRNVYLGTTRDYLIELEGGAELRVVTPSIEQHEVGTQVRIGLDPRTCRIVPFDRRLIRQTSRATWR